MNSEEIRKLIEQKKADLARFEYPEEEAERLYDEMLNECHPEMFGLLPCKILSECDPIQYRCGLADFTDGLDVTECEEYKELEKEIEELEEELEAVEAEEGEEEESEEN